MKTNKPNYKHNDTIQETNKRGLTRKEPIAEHVQIIIELLSKICSGKTLYAKDEDLQNELGVDETKLQRYLKSLKETYSFINEEKRQTPHSERKVLVYSATNYHLHFAKVYDFVSNKDEFKHSFLKAILENNTHEFANSFEDDGVILDGVKKDSTIFRILNNPFEEIWQDTEKSKVFDELELAVKNQEYRNIEYIKNNKPMSFVNAKCLKIIFMHNNWYLAIEDEHENFQVLRMAFIEKVTYCKSKNSFQTRHLEKYNTFFSKIQNAYTLFDTMFKTAILEVNKTKARFFEPNMKKFFPTQKYICTLENGNVRFSVDYTQNLEIFPFIKEWIPNIKIIEPQVLKDEFRKDLELALKDCCS